MKRLAAFCALVVSLMWAVSTLDASLSGVTPRMEPCALEKASQGRPGELMAVVLPAPKGPPVVPPVVPPPVIPPPPIPGGRGRSEGDTDQPGPVPPGAAVIPEPASIALLAVGASGLLGCRFLKRRRRS
jgi:hypothetical protein